MKTILTIKNQDISPDSPVLDDSKFATRQAARAVLLDRDGGVFLLKVGLHNYHKLPGGGIDEGEDIKEALARELMEELGCQGEVIAELGTIIQHLDEFELVQTSYCYLAKQTGEQVEAALEEGEIAEGLHEVKAGSIDEAIKLLENDVPNNYEGRFIQKRDLAFLKAAKEAMK
ncbi:MAG: NUDIX domain-containing protein [Candidatus Saccharimonadales bacterium]